MAGQSLDRRLDDVIWDELIPWFVVAVFTVTMAVIGWIYYVMDRPPSPWILTAFAALTCPVAVLKLWRGIRLARRIRLGRDGERMVAETLQELVAAGWRVFHDVPGEGFNIDHVAIGPGGILAIETKTYSKLIKGESRVFVSDSGISIEGRQTSKRIIDQATRQAEWLAKKLQAGTSRTYGIRPCFSSLARRGHAQIGSVSIFTTMRPSNGLLMSD